MIQTSSELTGLEKASVLLMSLGSEASEEVLRRLSPEERDLLGAQIVRMRSVKSVIRERVLGEVSEAIRFGNPGEAAPYAAGIAFPQHKIPQHKGGSHTKGGPHTSDTGLFRWLESFEPERVAGMLASERPHTIALVLSHLSPNTVSSVFACLDDKTRNAAACSLTQAGKASQDVLRTIDELMRKRALDSLERHNVRTSERSNVQTFKRGDAPSSLEDLVGLPDTQVRELLGEADLDDLSLTLRVASDELRSVVLRVVPATTAELLSERLEATTQIKIREIEMAQQRVLKSVIKSQSLNVATL